MDQRINPPRLPPVLQALIESARAGHVDYPGWERDWQRIEEVLSKGNYDVAQYWLSNLCQQQDNLRSSGS